MRCWSAWRSPPPRSVSTIAFRCHRDLPLPGRTRQLNCVCDKTAENAFATTESICHRVRRWRSGTQARRWATMALLKAERGFTAVATPATMALLADALQHCLAVRDSELGAAD